MTFITKYAFEIFWGCFAIGFVWMIGYMIYDYAIAEKFSLRKDEWTCTKSHQETITTFTKIGDVMVPMTTYVDVCDVYKKASK